MDWRLPCVCVQTLAAQFRPHPLDHEATPTLPSWTAPPPSPPSIQASPLPGQRAPCPTCAPVMSVQVSSLCKTEVISEQPRPGRILSDFLSVPRTRGFLGGSDSKESACNAGDLGSIRGSRRSPREENGNPLQYSCLESPMDRGAGWPTVYWGRKESDMTEQLTHT